MWLLRVRRNIDASQANYELFIIEPYDRNSRDSNTETYVFFSLTANVCKCLQLSVVSCSFCLYVWASSQDSAREFDRLFTHSLAQWTHWIIMNFSFAFQNLELFLAAYCSQPNLFCSPSLARSISIFPLWFLFLSSILEAYDKTLNRLHTVMYVYTSFWFDKNKTFERACDFAMIISLFTHILAPAPDTHAIEWKI